MPIPPIEWFHFLSDSKHIKLFAENMNTVNILDFPNYDEKIEKAKKASGENEGVKTGIITIHHIKTALGVLDPLFMLGSMGSVVGEKITRLIEYAAENKLPLIFISASGGARMQEGIFSLMQMAKTSAALKKLDKENQLYISVLTNPTTGGVTASFAMLGDINIGEPGALIGFAGPRVIKQTIGKDLPHGFQTAEFLEEHGMLDLVVKRKDMKDILYKLLKYHGY